MRLYSIGRKICTNFDYYKSYNDDDDDDDYADNSGGGGGGGGNSRKHYEGVKNTAQSKWTQERQ